MVYLLHEQHLVAHRVFGQDWRKSLLSRLNFDTLVLLNSPQDLDLLPRSKVIFLGSPRDRFGLGGKFVG